MIDLEKMIIAQSNVAQLQCLKCGNSNATVVTQYNSIEEKAVGLHVECACDHSFTVMLDSRKYFQKKLALEGIYRTENGLSWGKMIVLDLSRSGMNIKLDKESDIQIDEKSMVDFYIHDNQHSFISKEVAVKSIDNLFIEAKFLSKKPGDMLASNLVPSIELSLSI